jgi:hypothetical protein
MATAKGLPPLAVLLLALAAAAGAGEPPAASPGMRPGTARMAARLQEIARASDPSRNPILNAERAELFRGLLEKAKGTPDEMRLRIALGSELLLAGKTAEAIEHLAAARTALAGAEGGAAAALLLRAREMLALAYLRRGEQENCVERHNIDSCLLPIRGSGVHALKRGSRLAYQEYLALLEEHPENLEYRWLLNLAAMTLGEYPDKVPARWVVPPASFESAFPLPRFTDVAPGLGLDRFGLAGGALVDDFTGDGHLDVLASSWGLLDPIRFFRNNADGTFTDRTAEAGLTGVTGGLHLAAADYDNDGDLDVILPRGAWVGVAGQGDHPNSLLRNNGDGTFEDVTEAAGLLSFHPTQAVAWGDYDNDGWLDLFIGNESTGKPEHPSELYRNNGDGTFTDVAAEAGVAAPGFVKGATWGDYDNDGRLDLYLSRFGQRNVLYRNLGPAPAAEGETAASGRRPWRFEDVTEEAGVAEPLKSFPTWFFDYDNDGWLDLLVAPFLGFVGRNQAIVAAEYFGVPAQGEQPRLYRNRGDGTFEDVTRAAGLARPMLVMGSNFGDLDNDGFLDLYLATGEPNLGTLVPNRMFRNDGGRTFQDVTTAGGFGHLQKGHAVAFADIDNDGDQEVYAVMGGAYSGDTYWNALFQNPGSGNRWITLRLEGVESNRSAIGARLRLVVETEGGAERILHATVGATGSFGSSSLQQEIGLGKARSLRAVEVTWPRTGKVQVFRNLALDRVFRLREGSPEPIPVELKRLDLSPAAGPHRHQG